MQPTQAQSQTHEKGWETATIALLILLPPVGLLLMWIAMDWRIPTKLTFTCVWGCILFVLLIYTEVTGNSLI